MPIKNKVKKPTSQIKRSSSFYSFSPKINLFLLFIVGLGTFVTVATLQQRQDVRQNAATTPKENTGSKGDERNPRDTNPPSIPINVVQPGDSSVPSPVCGGSNQGSVCPSEAPAQPWQPNPSQPGQIEPEPDNQEQQPNPGEPNQIEPEQPVEDRDGGNNGGGNNGGGNTGGTEGLLNRIIEMLNQIMEMIRQILGGGGGTPTPNDPGNPNNPQPSTAVPSTNPGDPGNPQPSTVAPSANPGDPGNPQPTVAPSTAVPSTAPSGAAADTTAPSAPANLKATAAAGGKINLTWTAATDNAGGSGIKEYEVYRSQGDARNGGNTGINFNKKVGTVTKYTDSGLTTGTTYYYYIRAYDKAGNRGEHSNTAGATAKK